MEFIELKNHGKIVFENSIKSIKYLIGVVCIIFLANCSAPFKTNLKESTIGTSLVIQKGHVKEITCVAFSHDDQLIATGSNDGTIKIWETSTGRVTRTLFDSSRDGKWVTRADLYGNAITRYYSLSDTVTAVSFFSDNRLLLSAGLYGNLKLWDVTKGALLNSIQVSKWQIKAVRYCDTYDQIIIVDSKNQILLVNAKTYETQKMIAEFSGNEEDIEFTASCKYAISKKSDGSLVILDLHTVEIKNNIASTGSPIRTLSISGDSKQTITGHQDGEVRVWDNNTGKFLNLLKAHSTDIVSIKINPADHRILATNSGESVKIWNIQTGELIREFSDSESSIDGMEFSHDGNFLLAYNRNLTLSMWHIDSGVLVRRFKGASGLVNSAAFSPDGRYVLTGLKYDRVNLWDVATGTQIKSFKFKPQVKFYRELHRINIVGFSPDGSTIAALSSDGRRKLWDLESGEVVNDRTFTIRSNSLAFSPDGRYYLTVDVAGSINLWSVSTGELIRKIGEHQSAITATAFSPDGRLAATGSKDNTVKVWRIYPQSLIRTLKGHEAEITSVSFSPSGKFILSASQDATTRIWNAESGQEIIKLISTTDGEWLAATPDGYYKNSIEGHSLLSWVFDDTDETYSYEQFESQFQRPDIIKSRLAGNPDAGKPPPVLARPPIVQMKNHMAFEKTQSERYELKIHVAGVEKVNTVRVYVNGRPSAEVPVAAVSKALQIEVPIVTGLNRLTVVAYDSQGYASNPKYVDVWSDQGIEDRPALNIVSIGVSKYSKLPASWQLDYAHTDAAAIIEAFRQQEGNAFKTINERLLINENATTENLLEAIEKLESADKNDLIVIHMAGHGVRKSKEGTFYFLTYDSNLDAPDQTGISWDKLVRHLERIRSRIIIFLDACHSGSIVDETVVPNEQLAERLFTESRSGVMVFSASKGRQMSMESPDIGGGFGVFSYALVQCLGPRSRDADSNRNGYLEFYELVDWVMKYVDNLTDGEQTPWLSRKEMLGDIPLVRIR